MRSFFRREPGFYRNLIALALPILIQNLITNSLGLVDTFMVGILGEGPLAGVTLANIPVFVVQLMMFGIQSGSAVLISQYRGGCMWPGPSPWYLPSSWASSPSPL